MDGNIYFNLFSVAQKSFYPNACVPEKIRHVAQEEYKTFFFK